MIGNSEFELKGIALVVFLFLSFAFGSFCESCNRFDDTKKLSNALSMYEEARSDGLLWRSRYEERASRLRVIEARDAKMRKLIKDKRALPMVLP